MSRTATRHVVVLGGGITGLAAAWEAMGAANSAPQRAAAATIAGAKGPFRQGRCSGLLFGDPQRYVQDLAMQLEFRADMLDFAAAVRRGAEWKQPLQALHASWSAWQWVRIILSINFGLTFESSSHSVVLTGGSIMIPLWFSQMIKPEVFSCGSKPWLGPRQVTPKSGGTNGSCKRSPIW